MVTLTKHHGLGNDFLVVFHAPVPVVELPELARRLCDRRRGVEAKLVIDNPGAAPRTRDLRLCRQVAQAHLWFSQLPSQQASSIRAIARREGLHECDVSRTLRLAFLAPDIVETILAGRQPLELTAETLRRLARLPMAWTAQRRLLGFSSQ